MKRKSRLNCVFFAVYDTVQVFPSYLIFAKRLLSYLQTVVWVFRLSF